MIILTGRRSIDSNDTRKYPEAKLTITCDDHWMSAVEVSTRGPLLILLMPFRKDDKVFPSPQELLERVEKTHEIIENKGKQCLLHYSVYDLM